MAFVCLLSSKPIGTKLGRKVGKYYIQTGCAGESQAENPIGSALVRIMLKAGTLLWVGF